MSRWRKGIIPIPNLHDADPWLLTPCDPWAGDEAVLHPADYAQYVRYSRRPDKISGEAHAAHDADFRRLYRAVLDGDASWNALAPVLAAMNLDEPRAHDVRPLNLAPGPVSDGLLADTAEDQVPAIGMIAADRILGPMSEEPIPRWVRRQAGAAMAFVPLLRAGVSPVARAVYQRPRPPTRISSAFRAIARTPPMLWRAQGGRLTPALPFIAAMHPTAPVNVPDGAVVLGRVVPIVGGQWWVACALPLPAMPDPDILIRRMTLEMWRLRRLDHRISWEDVLRERGEVLYRTACEWCWLRAPDETLALWAKALSAEYGTPQSTTATSRRG